MKLAIVAYYQPVSLQKRQVSCFREKPVHPAAAVFGDQFPGSMQEHITACFFHAGLYQHAGTGGRGIGNGGNQLGKIAQANALPGFLPGMIEHELTIGIELTVQGHGSHQPVLAVQGQVHGKPAEVLTHATMGFHGGEKFMLQEGMIFRYQRVPFGSIDFVQSGMNTNNKIPVSHSPRRTSAQQR